VKIAWIFPQTERCGIALYSQSYLKHLDAKAAIERFDPHAFINDRKSFLSKINACDIVHIQYETSFFLNRNTDFYPRLCASIRRPIVVSLHEVYRQFPGVFPREDLTGDGMILRIKQFLYDRRHPVQTAWRKYLQTRFFGKQVIVHYEFQKEILCSLGIPKDKVLIVPHPVDTLSNDPPLSSRGPASGPAHLASLGFINPNFNYDLLFDSLKLIDLPWRFTWVGGIRRGEDQALLDKLRSEIQTRGWDDRFRITGWVDSRERDGLLASADAVCALFSARSSSGSLLTCLAAGRLVVATPLPLTRELLREGVLHLVPATPEGVAGGIRALISNTKLRETIHANVVRYQKETSYEKMSDRLFEIYSRIIT
jgi:glycosyltransferase involved in cell wall biosynthesis